MSLETQHDVLGQNQQEPPDYADILGKLVNKAYKKAKTWSGVVAILEISLFLSGIIAVFSQKISLGYPWIALPIALVGVFISSKSSGFKNKAETLKRNHEYLMGFGTIPNRGDLADLQIELSKELPKDDEELLLKGITYWSKKSSGPIRTLENLMESAWFTKHLAGFCAYSLGAVFLVSLALAVSLLLLCATSLAGTPVGLAASKCIAATIMFLISTRVLVSWLAYLGSRKNAEAIDSAASDLLATAKRTDIFEVQKLLSEYQIARASAPLIPTWVWKIRRNTLNKAWENLKHPTE